jgi:hypothetical protein
MSAARRRRNLRSLCPQRSEFERLGRTHVRIDVHVINKFLRNHLENHLARETNIYGFARRFYLDGIPDNVGIRRLSGYPSFLTAACLSTRI